MAVTLQVPLTDEQQAVMETYAPEGLTNAEKLEWAEQVAAEGLKLAVIEVARTAGREAARVLRDQARSDIVDAWPEDPVQV